ncbi:unnamed protein product [Lactuca virosa]|uniref:Uncharacterized protein n=1 Tax=Lactuca virosa TaxID=75947 RepID=A0AAU9P331_9ASTR|nr:unnamed protein product [Lactuca virosa]
MEYLETINPDDGSGKLLPKETTGPSKKSRKSKKDVTITPEKPVQEPKKKTSPPKQTKADAQVSTVVVDPLSDGSFKSSSMVRKPYLNHQCIFIRKVPAPVSPSSKKRRVEDVATHISKKKLKK